MNASLVYRNRLAYELVMRALYGRHYPARYEAVASLIPAAASVLDVCCGPGTLYERQLRKKHVDYTGLDLNPRFARRVSRLGGRGLVGDVAGERELPRADYVLMQASLYQFLPDPRPVLRRLRAAARERVIIAEPVRNLSSSSFAPIRVLARRCTNAGQGARPLRFDTTSLDALMHSLEPPPYRSFEISGGRERVYLLAPEPGGA